MPEIGTSGSMSEDEKRRDATWPQRPRSSSTLPPRISEDLDAEAARRFILGKLFAFTCADGTRGAARIYDDGSVIGTIQFHDSAQPRPIWLPSETLKLTGEAVCGSLNRIGVCFALSKTSEQSFRASVTGLDFAYCATQAWTRTIRLTANYVHATGEVVGPTSGTVVLAEVQ
jgi:hypothetical protein